MVKEIYLDGEEELLIDINKMLAEHNLTIEYELKEPWGRPHHILLAQIVELKNEHN